MEGDAVSMKSWRAGEGPGGPWRARMSDRHGSGKIYEYPGKNFRIPGELRGIVPRRDRESPRMLREDQSYQLQARHRMLEILNLHHSESMRYA